MNKILLNYILISIQKIFRYLLKIYKKGQCKIVDQDQWDQNYVF